MSTNPELESQLSSHMDELREAGAGGEAERLAEIIARKAKDEALGMARLLVSKADHELLGATEFEIRDRVHRIGAHALATAVNERKKRGTKAPAAVVRTATKRPGSSTTGPRTL